jgi:hypothetical protein
MARSILEWCGLVTVKYGENPMSEDATKAPQGMKRPKYAAMTMQQQSDARMNPFALQLMAEAHADDKSLFGDETVMAVARSHDGTAVFLLVSTRQPTREQFEGWPE